MGEAGWVGENVFTIGEDVLPVIGMSCVECVWLGRLV